MCQAIAGIHHLTAVASDPQRNLDFYTNLLGLRLIKKTVNFDDPSAYHLYYGDSIGSPGSIITFFYWPGPDARGTMGAGQSTAIVFSAPADSIDFWQERLTGDSIQAQRRERFGETVLAFSDPDGIPIELVAVADDARSGWDGGDVPDRFALKGMHTVEVTVRDATPTESLLTNLMGFKLVTREGARSRFETASGGSGRYIDIIVDAAAGPGIGGTGTVHHVAWCVPNAAAQLKMQDALRKAGYSVSHVVDRSYFHSIYYREAGGVLFEVATAGPGFAIDESEDSLGIALKLPAKFEAHRREIERALPPLRAKNYVSKNR